MGSIPMYEADEFLSSFDQSGIIGFGSFGRVRDCFHRKLGRVAVKCFGVEGNAQDSEELRQKLLSEAEILQNINHQQIVQCQGVTLWSNAFGIIMEFMVGGNLDEFLMNDSVKFASWGLRLRIVEELCEALAFLHYFTQVKTIVHGDLKPHNILLTRDLHAKLADFGAAQIAMSTGSSSTLSDSLSRQHTVLYTAPEFLQNIHSARTPAMDIYSLSMIIYEVITRTRVFHGVTGNIGLIISTIVNCEQRPDMKPVAEVKAQLQSAAENGHKQDVKTFELLESLMKKSWKQNPADRPEIDSIRDSLSDELSVLDQADLLSNVAKTVGQMRRSKSNKDTKSTAPLNQFMFPFEIANSRSVSRTSSRSSIKTKMSVSEPCESCIIVFVESESNCCDVFQYFPESKRFQKLPPLPREWNNSTAVVLDKCVYVISATSIDLLDVEVRSPQWVRKPLMITPRTYSSAGAYKGKIYVLGGIADGNKPLASIECYDPATESWSAVDNLRANRFGHKVIFGNGKLYCVGGGNSLVESYDPITGETWALTETPNKNGFDSVFCNDVIYDIGRNTKTRTSVKGTKSAIVTYSIDCYNVKNDFWYKGRELTTNRSQGNACALNGKVYLVGGWGKKTSCQYIECYNPKADSWDTVASMNFGFVKHVCSIE